MTTVTIRGIEVKFPFTPYAIQTNYMEKVIECLQTQQNGILESPTGTGKTLSLLCSSLAWLDNHITACNKRAKEILCSEDLKDEDITSLRIPKIIYSSRTHSQLLQAMQEMKRSGYGHMNACVLGSRDLMCINPKVTSERDASAKLLLCRNLVKQNGCEFHSQVEKCLTKPPISEMEIIDMEDIVSLGRECTFCPYYMSRELKKSANVVFMPYNYLLDIRTAQMMGIDVQGDIVIVDEAHNIEKVCEEAVSFAIKTTDFESAVDDLDKIQTALERGHFKAEIKFSIDELVRLKAMLNSLKESLFAISLVQLGDTGTVFDGDYIFKLLNTAGINDFNYKGISALFDCLNEFIAVENFPVTGYAFDMIANFLLVVFYKQEAEFKQKIKECFKVQIEEEKSYEPRFTQFTSPLKSAKCRILNFWCFCPGFGMMLLLDRKPHSIILTSGTLAPLKPLISELDLPVGVRIENPHIVTSSQVCVKVLSKGPDLELLNSNYQNRNNPKYIQSLGLVISNLVRIIPDGILIFFPSYVLMEKFVDHWQITGIWDAISQNKPIYVEPKDKAAFNTAMEEYYSKIKDPNYKGAIFMGVCRGKVSEGLDFADINGRAVFITGLPYPPLKDPKVILKKQYLDFRNSKDREHLRGDDWYSLEATRAVNQAIGRVIRHKDDYGAIILLDSRFANSRIKSNLSMWLRNHIAEMKNFPDIVKSIRLFFKQVPETLIKSVVPNDLEQPSVKRYKT